MGTKKRFNRRELVILFSIIVIASVGLYGLTALSPQTGGGDSFYILSGDIIKNFKFDKFDGDKIDGANMLYDNKLCFETQNVWKLEQDDIVKVLTYSDENTEYMYYKVFMTNTINIFTNVRLDQMAKSLKPVKEEFLAGSYEHQLLLGDHDFSWESYLTWNHYDFGDIRNYGFANNHFQGTLEMSFDIAESPLPDIFGEFAYKKFDYIAVSSAAVTSATYGFMSKDVPEILTQIPEQQTDQISSTSGGGLNGDIKGGFEYAYDPNIHLENIGEYNSFDAGMSFQQSGSMNPTQKSGAPIWDPYATGESMTDCKIRYNVYSLSPVVSEYGGKLTWEEQNIVTIDKWKLLKGFYVSLKQNNDKDMTEYRPIALHGWNRYIQAEIRVAFSIWTAVEIEALTEDYEYLKLHYPEEYYDKLIWSSIVSGFGGGTQYTADVGSIFGSLFDNFWTILIIIIVVGVGLYIFIKIGIPLIRRRITRRGYYQNG